MPYQGGIPIPPDILQQSQNDMLDNFQAINAFLQADHYSFADAFPGKHKMMRFQILTAGPLPTQNINYGMGYQPLTTRNNPPALVVSRPTGPAINIPFSYEIDSPVGQPSVFFNMIGYNIAQLEFAVVLNFGRTVERLFFPTQILTGFATPIGLPPFVAVYNALVQVRNVQLIFNDNNIDVQVSDLQPTSIQLSYFTRSGPPGQAPGDNAMVYISVIGSIS